MGIATRIKEHSIDLASYSEVSIDSGRAPIALSVWETEQDTAPTVVFIPGTMTHPLFYSPFLDAVSRHGYHVIGVHPLSHGRSPRLIRRFTLDDMIGNVRDAVGYACARFPGTVGLMGSSQGGILTLLAAAGEHRIRAAFPHNILFTPLRESLSVTRFPNTLGVAYPAIRRIITAAGRVLPGLQVPMSFYLDVGKVFSEREWRDEFYRDPLGLTSYPVSFLASLFATDMSALVDGSITCPVVAFVSTGDPLFTLDYSRLVYERLVAPHKRLIELPAAHHLILNEKAERVTPTILTTLDDYLR